MKNTKKIVLGIGDKSGTLKTLDTNHSYKEFTIIIEEGTIEEILNQFLDASWSEGKTDDYLGKMWQFFDSEDKLILEYEGHEFVTKEKRVTVSLQEENLDRLSSYFKENE